MDIKQKFLICTYIVLYLLWGIGSQQTSAQNMNLPDWNKVGPQAMPEGMIHPYEKNPYGLPQLSYPTFPDYTVSIGKEKENITELVNDLIVKISERGGGKVIIPAGYWKSGRIELKSNVNLYIDEGAVIEFSGDPADYLPSVYTMHEGRQIMGAGAFIYACDAENIAVTGKGKLIGPPMDFHIRKNRGFNSIANIEGTFPIDYKLRIFDGMEGRRFFCPKVISPVCCKNVLIEGITIERGLFWNVNPILCKNVIIRGITVNSVDVASGDGIDLTCCKDVLIEYCLMNCGDDCYAVKGARDEEGLAIGKPTENVLIRYCLAKEGHGGITTGSETSGGIRKLYVHSCIFDGTQVGIRFKTRRSRSGLIEDLVYEGIRMEHVRDAVVWDMLGSPYFMGDLAKRLPKKEVNPLTPEYREIQIRDFKVNLAQRFVVANGIPESPFHKVIIENGQVSCDQFIPVMNDFADVTIRNLKIDTKNNDMSITGGKNLLMENLSFSMPEDTLYVYSQETVAEELHFSGIENMIIIK